MGKLRRSRPIKRPDEERLRGKRRSSVLKASATLGFVQKTEKHGKKECKALFLSWGKGNDGDEEGNGGSIVIIGNLFSSGFTKEGKVERPALNLASQN